MPLIMEILVRFKIYINPLSQPIFTDRQKAFSPFKLHYGWDVWGKVCVAFVEPSATSSVDLRPF